MSQTLNAGSLFRLGNLNADARVDLRWGRPDTPWTWRGALGATDPDGRLYP